MKTIILLTALLLVTSAQANMSVERHRTFNASILNFDAYRYAVDLENWRHGTQAYGYRVGDRLKLQGSQFHDGHCVVYDITRDVLHVRFAKPRNQQAEPVVSLRITRIGH